MADGSELQEQLDDVLGKLADGMVRRDSQACYWEGQPIEISNVTAIDELEDIIRDWLCRPEIARLAR